jgi:hypothetical protein
MQNRKNVGYDETKKMLDTMRRLTESVRNVNILKEEDETDLKDDITVINDVDVKMLSTDNLDLKISDNHKNSISTLIDSFRQQVSDLADLDPGITINMSQIRMDGTIPNIDMGFVLISGDESGVYINADMLKIEDDVLESLEKLFKFHLTFEDVMNPIIRERGNN